MGSQFSFRRGTNGYSEIVLIYAGLSQWPNFPFEPWKFYQRCVGRYLVLINDNVFVKMFFETWLLIQWNKRGSRILCHFFIPDEETILMKNRDKLSNSLVTDSTWLLTAVGTLRVQRTSAAWMSQSKRSLVLYAIDLSVWPDFDQSHRTETCSGWAEGRFPTCGECKPKKGWF